MPDMTAGEMQAQGLCVGSCMVANGPHTSACGCRCEGELHGALRDIVLKDTARRRKPLPAVQDGPDMFRDDEHATPVERDVLCEQCEAVLDRRQAGAGYVRCTRCDPFGQHTAASAGGPCQTCTTAPALAGATN